jgi:parallel beta-helix repeat protein
MKYIGTIKTKIFLKTSVQSKRFRFNVLMLLILAPGGHASATALVPQDDWADIYVSSQYYGHYAKKAFDGDQDSYWFTDPNVESSSPPEIRIDLGATYSLSGFKYMPRTTGKYSGDGRIVEYRFYVTNDLNDWGNPVAAGGWDYDEQEKTVTFSVKKGRYIRFVAVRDYYKKNWAAVSELNVLHSSGDSTDKQASSVSTSTVATAEPLNQPDAEIQPDPINEPENAPLLSQTDVNDVASLEGKDLQRLVDTARGAHYLVGNAYEFNLASEIAQPGDVIMIKDGVYNWGHLKIGSHGTKDNPVIYTAQNRRKVKFVNSSTLFKVYGDWNVFGGFVIENVTDYAFFIYNAQNNRITDNLFKNPGNTNNTLGYIEIQKRSHNTRIDNNVVVSARSSIRILLNDESVRNGPTQGVTIDHNYFEGAWAPTRPVHVVQVGQGEPSSKGSSLLAANLLFEHNVVKSFDGGTSQIISNKSSGNTYRYNTILDSHGGILLRYGNDNQVIGNHFVGGSGGAIMIKGERNKILDNVVERGDGGSISELMWGERPDAGADAPRTGYNLIANNKLNTVNHRGFYLGYSSAGSDEPVYNSIYRDNLLVGTTGRLFAFNPAGCRGCRIVNNVYVPQGSAELGEGFNYDESPDVR